MDEEATTTELPYGLPLKIKAKVLVAKTRVWMALARYEPGRAFLYVLAVGFVGGLVACAGGFVTAILASGLSQPTISGYAGLVAISGLGAATVCAAVAMAMVVAS